MRKKVKEFEARATILQRLLAFIIDLIIIDVIIISSFYQNLEMIAKLRVRDALLNPFAFNLYMRIIPLFLLIVAYFFLFEYLIQTTPGKFVLGIIVKDENEKAPNAWKCFLKNMLFYPSWLFLLWWIIDIYYLIKNGERLTEKILKIKTVQVVKW